MYGKIFESMYDGTLSADWRAMVTFQQFIVLADSEGIVDYTPPALSRRTGIPLDILERGIEKLEQPDKYSRSPEQDGRRIALLDDHRPWGWVIVNYEHYRDLASREDSREKARLRKQKQRERRSQDTDSKGVSRSVTPRHAPSRMSRHEDADADETSISRKRAPKDFSLSPKQITWAMELGFTVDQIELQTETFKDHEFKSARKDWSAVWRNWMRRAAEWSKGAPKQKLSYSEQLAADMKEKGML